jgi:hypothetical protein
MSVESNNKSPKITYIMYDFENELSEDERFILSRREIILPYLWKYIRFGDRFEDIVGIRAPFSGEKNEIEIFVKKLINAKPYENDHYIYYEFDKKDYKRFSEKVYMRSMFYSYA